MVHLTDREGNSIDEADARDALEAALSAPRFASSPQLSDFLRYVVEETIAGRAADIKAYSIAVDALGKGEEFDPQDNAAVRVAAGRLRRNLALHNAENVTENLKLVITLEAGSYVPIFTSPVGSDIALATEIPGLDGKADVNATAAAEPVIDGLSPLPAKPVAISPDPTAVDTLTARRRQFPFHIPTVVVAVLAAFLISGATIGALVWRSSVPETNSSNSAALVIPTRADRQLRPSISATLLLPDEDYPDWFASGEVADSLAVTLARFDAYEFYGANVAREFPASGNHDADYLVLASAYDNAGSVRVFVQLLRGRDGVVLWSTQKLFPKPASGQAYDVPQIAGSLLSPLLSPYGVIFNDLKDRGSHRFALSCFITAYRYFYSESDEKHAAARDCAEELREKGSRLPSVYAALTFLYLDEYRENRNRLERDPLQAAYEAAARAVQLGPLSARAHQAEFAVHKVEGHRELARESGKRALALNPYDTDIMGDYAAWLISIGDVENGKALLDQATALLQVRPAWFDFYRFLGAELSREFKIANDVSTMMDISRSPLLAVAVAIGSHRRGEENETLRALQELRRVAPAMATDPKAALLRRGFDESIAQSLTQKLIEAGLNRTDALAN